MAILFGHHAPSSAASRTSHSLVCLSEVPSEFGTVDDGPPKSQVPTARHIYGVVGPKSQQAVPRVERSSDGARGAHRGRGEPDDVRDRHGKAK